MLEEKGGSLFFAARFLSLDGALLGHVDFLHVLLQRFKGHKVLRITKRLPRRLGLMGPAHAEEIEIAHLLVAHNRYELGLGRGEVYETRLSRER